MRVDPIVKGYLTTALFCADEEIRQEFYPEINNFSDDAKWKAKQLCSGFVLATRDIFELTGIGDFSIGGNLYYDSCGHGTGFTDEAIGMDESVKTVMEFLSQVARQFKGYDVVVGDDGRLYLE